MSTLQPLLRGIALVHAQQVAGEERGLVAAGAGPDLEDDAALVGRVLRQQRDQDLAGAGVDLDAGGIALLIGEVAELGIGRGVVDQRLGLGQRRHARWRQAAMAATTGSSSDSSLASSTVRTASRRRVDLVAGGGMARHDGVETILGKRKRHGDTRKADDGRGDGRGGGSSLARPAPSARPPARPVEGAGSRPRRARPASQSSRLRSLPTSSARSIALTGPIEAADIEKAR